MSLYPGAEYVPWKYESPQGPTYFKDANQPIAVVLHIAQGYATTARSWAVTGHYGASWHYTVARDGSVMQHLQHKHGGYHAGIPATAPTPTWPLWKGHGVNVNTYTIGIEHEGFSGDGFTPQQRVASRNLCKWLADSLGIPFDRLHFPAHADIDLINRPNDFGPPAFREEFYGYLFEEEDALTKEDIVALFGSTERDADGNLMPLDYRYEQALPRYRAAIDTGVSLLEQVGNAMAAAKGGEHKHEPGGVIK